jgi:nucleotide-binding universal stress UspA family protein
VDTLGSSTDLRWTLEVIQGAPGPVLATRSARARLLVLGAGKHTGPRGVVLGSVSHYCMCHALPPVVAVPATGAMASELEPAAFR